MEHYAEPVIKAYMNWLWDDILNGPRTRFKASRRLFKALLYFPYRYSHPMDKNRFKDGLDMRMEYCSGISASDEDILEQELPKISVLEVLIALSYRMEKDIMASTTGKFDCFRWFWGMICSLGLDDFDENRYNYEEILEICENFVDRKYGPNGENGGIFPLHFCKEPAFDMELWDQMNEFLAENY